MKRARGTALVALLALLMLMATGCPPVDPPTCGGGQWCGIEMGRSEFTDASGGRRQLVESTVKHDTADDTTSMDVFVHDPATGSHVRLSSASAQLFNSGGSSSGWAQPRAVPARGSLTVFLVLDYTVNPDASSGTETVSTYDTATSTRVVLWTSPVMNPGWDNGAAVGAMSLSSDGQTAVWLQPSFIRTDLGIGRTLVWRSGVGVTEVNTSPAPYEGPRLDIDDSTSPSTVLVGVVAPDLNVFTPGYAGPVTYAPSIAVLDESTATYTSVPLAGRSFEGLSTADGSVWWEVQATISNGPNWTISDATLLTRRLSTGVTRTLGAPTGFVPRIYSASGSIALDGSFLQLSVPPPAGSQSFTQAIYRGGVTPP